MDDSVRSIFDELARCHREVAGEERNECVGAVLHRVRAHRAEALEIATELAPTDWSMRAARADVLGEVCNGEPQFVDDVLPMLTAMAVDETDVDVIISIAMALGHTWDPRAGAIVVRWAAHPDESVRCQVADALVGCVRDEGASNTIEVLIGLTRDPDPRVRDMATFALGVSEVRSPEVGDALVACMTDDDPDTRAEAFMGLAQRGDRRIVGPLIAVFESGTVGTLEVAAAGELADARLHPALLAMSAWWGDEQRDILDRAIRRCDPATSAA